MNKSSKRHESHSKSSDRSSKRDKSLSTPSDRFSKRRKSLSEEFDRLQFLQLAKDISRIEDFPIYHKQNGYDKTELENLASNVWESLPRHEKKKYKDMIKEMRRKKDQLEATEGDSENQFDKGHKESPVEKGGRGKGKKKHRRGKGKRGGGGKGKGKA